MSVDLHFFDDREGNSCASATMERRTKAVRLPAPVALRALSVISFVTSRSNGLDEETAAQVSASIANDPVQQLRQHPGRAGIVQVAWDEIESLSREAENTSESESYRRGCAAGVEAWKLLLGLLGEELP